MDYEKLGRENERDRGDWRLSFIKSRAVNRLVKAAGKSENDLKDAIRQCFVEAIDGMKKLSSVHGSRSNLYHTSETALAAVDQAVILPNSKQLSSCITTSIATQNDHDLSDLVEIRRGVDSLAKAVRDIWFISLLRAVTGEDCEFVFLDLDDLWPTADLTNDIGGLIAKIPAFANHPHLLGKKRCPTGHLLASVVRISSFVIAPRCLGSGDVPDEHASPLQVIPAVIAPQLGACDAVWHDLPTSTPRGRPVQLDMEVESDVDLSPIGTTRYDIAIRRDRHYYRSYEGDIRHAMGDLIFGGLTLLRAPNGWLGAQSTKGWLHLPATERDTRPTIYHAYLNSSGQRLAISKTASGERVAVLRGNEPVERTIGFAVAAGATVVIT